MFTLSALITLGAGFAAVVMYGQSAWDLWRDRIDTKTEIQLFTAALGVALCGACAIVTAINSMVR